MSLWRRVYQERRRVVLPLIVFLLANVAVLILGVWPLRQAVVRGQAEALAARGDRAQAMLFDQQAQAARKSADDAGVELGLFYADVLPPTLGAANGLIQFWLERTATAAGVQYNASQSDYEQVRESHLWRTTSNAVLTGQYQNILRFLYAVETAPEFVIIEKVGLAQSGVLQQNSGGTLELALDVVCYYAPERAGPGTPEAASVTPPAVGGASGGGR
jgi:Tfp pilus assembly protein PilO